MSDLERPIEIVRVLPPAKAHAPLTVAEQMADTVSAMERLVRTGDGDVRPLRSPLRL